MIKLRQFPYLLIPAAAALALLILSPVRLRIDAKQQGFSARLNLRVSLLFGLIRLPFRFLIKFDAEWAKQDPFEAKKAFMFFKLTKSEELKPLKRMKPKKPRDERLPLSPILNALSIEKLVLKGHIALEDAANGVFLCGMLNALCTPLLTLCANLLQARTRKAVIRTEILPRFGEISISIGLEGIVKTYPAKLIKGLLSAFADKRAHKRKSPSGQKLPSDGERPKVNPNEKGENSCIPLKT